MRKNILLTPAELTGTKQTPRYDQTVGYARDLDAYSDRIVLKNIGFSSEGRPIPMLVAGVEPDKSPIANKSKERAVVLIQASIHAGEPDGKDAGFALFRDIALNKTPKGLLDDLVILFIPILNPDGHELFSEYNRINQNGPEKSGFRANSANLNLNRDFIKAQTPEIRAWLRLWREWQPDFFIDCHVTDGADFRYNITYEFSHHHEMNKGLTRWMQQQFEAKTIDRIEKKGNLLSRYIQMIDRRDPQKGIITFIATPRFATGYSALRNRIGLLVEAHSLKPFQSRVKGTFDLLFESLVMVRDSKSELLKLNAAADAASFNDDKEIVLRQRISRRSREFMFKGYDYELFGSSISGAKEIKYKKEPKDFRVPQYDQADVVIRKKVPAYYIVPPQWQEVIEVLKTHGVKGKRLKKAIVAEVESYRFENPKWRTRPFEGRFNLSAKTIPLNLRRELTANSFVISTNDPLWQVIAHFLEPEGPDSAFAWGFFDAIFEQKEYAESYIMEEIAKKMLAEDPKLKEEFNEKLRDPKFASNPRARVAFFYERSKFFDPRIGKYPVSRISSEQSIKEIEAASKLD